MKQKKLSCEIFTAEEKNKYSYLSIYNAFYYDKENRCTVATDGYGLICSKKEYKEEFANKIISQITNKEIEGRYPNYQSILADCKRLVDITIPNLSEEVNLFWSINQKENKDLHIRRYNKKRKYAVKIADDLFVDMFYYYNVMLPLGVENFRRVHNTQNLYYEDKTCKILICAAKYSFCEMVDLSEYIFEYI